MDELVSAEGVVVRGIICANERNINRSLEIHQKLSLPVIREIVDTSLPPGIYLNWSDKEHLELVFVGISSEKLNPYSIDFTSSENIRRRRQSKSELLIRALGKLPDGGKVWDLTAGLGRDSLIMVSSGWHVEMFERNGVLAVLLDDAIRRFHHSEPDIGRRLKCHHVDIKADMDIKTIVRSAALSTELLLPNVVYLDPMYSNGFIGKKAKVKKDTQILHFLNGKMQGMEESNNVALFQFARAAAQRRVVVKRPLNAPPLCDVEPDSRVTGSSQRFDIYLTSS